MPKDQLRIMTYRHSVFYSPLIAAIAAGFLEDEGLAAVYFPRLPQRSPYEMFRNAELDIMQAAVSTSWDPLSKGERDIPLHFAQINQRDGFFLVGRPGRGAFEWDHLEGARLLADHAQRSTPSSFRRCTLGSGPHCGQHRLQRDADAATLTM